MIYKIKCPKCDQQADSLMKKDGSKGTYRELYTKYSPYRVSCSSCGLSKEIENGSDFKYELWYKTSFKGKAVWANNVEHIDDLINWLNEGKRVPGDHNETLPKWMVTNRKQVTKKLSQLKENR